MTEIKAYIREAKVDGVVRALEAQGVKQLTLVPTRPVWTDAEPEFVDIAKAKPTAHYARIVKLELVCRDEESGHLAGIIAEQARTGEPGDGMIFFSTIDKALRIRTGRTDDAALY